MRDVRQHDVVTIEEVIRSFLAHCRYEKCLSEKTISAYKVDCYQLESFMANEFGTYRFEFITKDMLKGYIRSISVFKPKTVKRKIASMKALFSYYEYEHDTFVNPIRKIKLQLKEPKTLPTVMLSSEVELILRYFYEKRDGKISLSNSLYKTRTRDICLMELLFATGIRVAELCNLRCEDVDLENGSIKVNGKGSKERVIQICMKDVLSILKEYDTLAGFREFFFVNRNGNRVSEQFVRTLVGRCVAELKIGKKITPHTFRHTFATLLLESDVDIKYIQALLGHSSIVTTQIYTHVNLNKQKEILLQKHPRNGIMVTRGKSSDV